MCLLNRLQQQINFTQPYLFGLISEISGDKKHGAGSRAGKHKSIMSLKVHPITFNPFEENTYIISSEQDECMIIDPGCYDTDEQNELARIITSLGKKPVKLINTHCHIDHILGNAFVSNTYNLQ